MDWIRLFEDNSIRYVTSGPNVSKGNIGFRCPFCGENDPSTHGGVNLATGKWNCWRDATHRGTSPIRLIGALLGVSDAQAKLVIEAYTGASLDDFDTLGGFVSTPDKAKKPLGMPPEFEHIEAYTLTHKFWVYLYNRGFDKPNEVIEDYALKCCLTGRWKGRLIIPVYGARNLAGPKFLTFNQEIVGSNPTEPTMIGWQGRSIRTVEGVPRYLTSNPDVKRTLYNLQNLDGGDRLYICEGPFDGLKIDHYGKPSIRATCTFGVVPTPEQLNQLLELKNRFKKIICLFDADAAGLAGGYLIQSWVPGITLGNLPDNMKDIGEASATQIRRFLHG